MKNRKSILLFLASGLIAAGMYLTASAEEEKADKNIFAMDTFMTLSAQGPNAQEAIDAAASRILELDAELSTGNENSVIARLNQSGSAEVTDDMKILLDYSMRLNEETNGCYNIAVYPVKALWGFTTGEYYVPQTEELEALRPLLDLSKLSYDAKAGQLSFLQEGMAIDFGAIAKGYTSASIMDIFREYGVTRGLVNLGGNVQAFGTKEGGAFWRIALKDPEHPDDAFLGILDIADEAVITSGGYERFFEQDGRKYHHIIDPKTLCPSESGLISVTIVSRDGTLADGLSTSLFVMGKEAAVEYWQEHSDEFETVLVEEDGSVFITEGLEGRFTTEKEYQVLYIEE